MKEEIEKLKNSQATLREILKVHLREPFDRTELEVLAKNHFVTLKKYNCQVLWDQKIIDSMIKTFYQRNSTNNVSLDEFEYWFDITGLQRHLKAIGIFSRLFYRDGKENYLNDIPRTQKYVNEVLNKYTELKDMKETFHKLGLDN